MDRSSSPDEAAAIAAALARFEVEAAPPAAGDEDAVGPWQRVALAEGVGAKGNVERHLERGGSKWLS